MRRIKIIILIIAFSNLPFLSFSQNTKQKTPSYLLNLKSRSDFDLLKGEPLSNTFNGIECIKLVYVISDKTLFYLESKKYKWHYRFAQEVLNDPDDLENFNLKNYSRSKDRKYILATFNYNVNTKNYFLQFAPCDNPSDELINILTQKISETFFKHKEFKLLLNTTVLLRKQKELSEKNEVFTSDELFKNQSYQAICKGKTKGILKFIDADSIKQNVNYSNNILILKGNSNQIPVCKGIVTDEFQTPLSHICLLTNNRKTPAAAFKNIFSVDSLKNYENKPVELIVGDEKFQLKYTTITSDNNVSKIKNLIKIISDTSTAELADLNKLNYKDRKTYGSKVCNLAELKKLERKKQTISTPPDAFGIPFYYYVQYIKKNKINIEIEKLVSDSVIFKSDSLLDLQLKKIRNAIRKNKIDTAFLNHVTAMCFKRFGKNKTRFRSSSNCEDEGSFNGAGLYTSETGTVGDTVKSIETAIKKVWASLWTIRAFKERQFFNFNHSTVYMGILVNAAFDNEFVNGVAITKNLYRDYEFGFVINMQKGEEEVVSPKPGMVCEQVVSYMNNGWSDFYNANRSADWISFSNLNPSASLLSNDELLQLTQQLESIKRYFYDLYKLWPKVDYKNFAMDVEFKVIEGSDKKRKFVFKQARPYNN